jgi:hypothetical protein
VGHSKSARETLKKYAVGVLPAGEGKKAGGGGKAGGAPSGSSGSAGGGFITYLIPALAVAAAVWFQFLRPKAAGADQA